MNRIKWVNHTLLTRLMQESEGLLTALMQESLGHHFTPALTADLCSSSPVPSSLGSREGPAGDQCRSTMGWQELKPC
ncbi:hypothetical protein O3P69_002286 [Scylla paramamosain]|uniref:Uncharacterized protein n=1 Tax=Scylla paramamosain TaxID=85552 RepID=A0AAW0V5L9_SCYPA